MSDDTKAAPGLAATPVTPPDSKNEARKTLRLMDLTGNEGGLAYDTIHNLLAHIERLEAENVAIRKVIAAVESDANSHEQLASEFTSNEGMRVIHRLAARGLRAALAQTDERKAAR